MIAPHLGTEPVGAPIIQSKARHDDTRARIIETAEALFRRLGFAKTAVADIAAALRMSPANIYRFFPSKNAIVQAICQRCLVDLEEKAWAVARARGSAAERLERLTLDIYRYHRENLLSEQRVHDMVQVAMEENWAAILAHKDTLRTVYEMVLRDGIESGEFERAEDPREASDLIMRSLACYCHPMLIAQGLQDGRDLEADARASVRFLLRALTPRS